MVLGPWRAKCVCALFERVARARLHRAKKAIGRVTLRRYR